MIRYCIGGVCQFVAAPAVAIAALAPGGIWVYRELHWLYEGQQDPGQMYAIYSGADLLEAGIIALGGFIASYVLFRLGSHLKARRGSGGTEHDTSCQGEGWLVIHWYIGVLCQWGAAPVVAVAGLVPGGIFVYRWMHSLRESQFYLVYGEVHVIRAVIIALGAFAASYILSRLGSQLKANGEGARRLTTGVLGPNGNQASHPRER